MQPMANMALRAARRAGQIIARAIDRVDMITVEEKQKNDLVSEIDRAAETAIVDILHKAYPGHSIIGEESGQAVKGDEDYTWIIDPLDGTTNFLHGIPHFAVSIGCVHRGRLEHAVVLDPLRDESFIASRGHGAQLNEKRIRVTRRDRLDSAVVGTGIPFSGTEAHLEAYIRQLTAVSRTARGVRRAGSAALDLAYVAAGRFDAFWEIGLKPWDMAAGALLVTEAGGLVSDFEGGSAFMETGNIVCGNPKCFKALLQTIAPHVTKDMKRQRPAAE
jgi:myo-inositol-1(or 4)-monophosphatase